LTEPHNKTVVRRGSIDVSVSTSHSLGWLTAHLGIVDADLPSVIEVRRCLYLWSIFRYLTPNVNFLKVGKQ